MKSLSALFLALFVALLLSPAQAQFWKSKPKEVDKHAAETKAATEGAIKMPAGVDLERARLLDQARKTKVYAEMVGIGDASNEKLLFPPAVAKAVGVTTRQMQRRFSDTLARSRRFEIFDASSTVTAEATDIVIDGMVTGTTQELVPIEGGVRVSMTRVRLSLQMKDRYTGKQLFPAAVEVVGQTGRSTGDRVVLSPQEREDDPAVQRRLAVDYERAMQRAFDEAARRIHTVLRPLARVLAVEDDQINLLGGSTHGLQGGDELVIFRSVTTRVGDVEVIASSRAVMVVRCEGVGTLTSQCQIIRKDPKHGPPKEGDYAVLSDVSSSGVREE
jgi:NAD(P)H-hydrate repair Nnr-like enzyme with NAD(P)H-hydrate epimerase domain